MYNGLRHRPLGYYNFLKKLGLNDCKYAKITYHIYLLSLVSKAHLNISKEFTVLLIHINPGLLRQNSDLINYIGLLSKAYPKISISFNEREGFRVFRKNKTICNILLATKDNCVAAVMNKVFTKYFYLEEELTYQQKDFKRRLDTIHYGYFAKRYEWLNLNYGKL